MSALVQVGAQQAAPPLPGMSAPDGVSAWRQVFEREQMMALARFRSVSAPTNASAHVPGSAARSTTAGGGAAAPAAASAAAGRQAAAAPLRAFSPLTPQAATLPLPAANAPAQQPWTGAALRQPAAAGLPASPAERAAAALAALTEKWPWRKLHCTVDADGLHLWLRDAAATPQDPALQRWLAGLQRSLAAAGTPLASFTLNGKACLVPSVLS